MICVTAIISKNYLRAVNFLTFLGQAPFWKSDESDRYFLLKKKRRRQTHMCMQFPKQSQKVCQVPRPQPRSPGTTDPGLEGPSQSGRTSKVSGPHGGDTCSRGAGLHTQVGQDNRPFWVWGQSRLCFCSWSSRGFLGPRHEGERRWRTKGHLTDPEQSGDLPGWRVLRPKCHYAIGSLTFVMEPPSSDFLSSESFHRSSHTKSPSRTDKE